MLKAREAGLDAILLSHFEVFAEVLISAPPVGVNHAETLASPGLMEVGVAEIVLDAVSWESPITVACIVRLVSLANSVPPVANHVFLLVLDHNPKEEGLVHVEAKQHVHETDAVLRVEWINLPVGVSNGVLEEASDVFEGSPFLSVVSRLLPCVDEFAEVTVSLFHQGSIDHKLLSCHDISDHLLTCLPCQHARGCLAHRT